MKKNFHTVLAIILVSALSIVSALATASSIDERIESLLPVANSAMQEVNANSSAQVEEPELRINQIHNLSDLFQQRVGRFSTVYYPIVIGSAMTTYISGNNEDVTRSFLSALETLDQKDKLPAVLEFKDVSVSKGSDGFIVFSLYLYKMRLLMQQNWKFSSELTDKLQCSDTEGLSKSEISQLNYMCTLLTDSANDPVMEQQETGGIDYYVNAVRYAGRQLASFAQMGSEEKYRKNQARADRLSPIFRDISPEQHATESAIIYSVLSSFVED